MDGLLFQSVVIWFNISSGSDGMEHAPADR